MNTAKLSAAGRRVLVIFNPTAGRRRRRTLAAVLRHLERAGCQVTVRPTAARGDAETLARAASAEGWDVVAVAGGDGTINEAVNGLYGHALPLAVIPLGTANVVAAELCMPSDPEAIADVIAEAPIRDIHLGEANGRLFVMMAGVGFDARVVEAMPAWLKRGLGKGAYVLMFLAGLYRFSRSPYRVTVDGETHGAASAVIANGHFYAGRHSCAPLARLGEPLLYICLFLRPGPLHALRYGLWLLLGRLERLDDALILPGEKVTIEGPAGQPVQGDGDIIGRVPLTAGLSEKTLSVVAPPEDWAAGRGQVEGDMEARACSGHP
ncbi:MAG: diacylglycerol kinase family lipid kinase [Rhodospirillales bacterium]|jgi:YegS/Rv2252/BmrU family lipid kinase|nr:diacylglycerol kinase family lipid kinase [Rhodospirillales bacterium]